MARLATKNDVESYTTCVYIDDAIKMLKKAGSHDAILANKKLKERFEKLVPAAGTVVNSFKKGTVQVLNTDSHDICIASSGRKKTRSEIIPTVISFGLKGYPMVINDMKGEILSASKGLLEAMGYRIIVLDYRNPESSPNSYNLLSLAWHRFMAGDPDGASRVIRNIAEVLYSELSSNTNDAYWTHMSIEYFCGLSLGLLEYNCPLDAFTLETIFATANMDNPTLKVVFTGLKDSIAERNVHGTLYAPNDTRASIQSVFGAPLSAFCSQRGLMEMMSWSDFTPIDLAKEKTALFIVSPDENANVSPIVTAIFSQLMSELVSFASRHNGVLLNTVQFILDEFGNLKRISNYEHIVSASRSRGIRLHIVLQSTSQLSNVYGKNVKDIIIGNVYNWIFLGTRDIEFLKEFSERLGTTLMPSGRKAPVLSVSALGALEKRNRESEAICLIEDLKPFHAALPDYDYFEDLPTPIENPAKTRQRARKPFNILKAKHEATRSEKNENEIAYTDIEDLKRRLSLRIAEFETEETAKASEW